ncbi:MAG: hypothetical protein ACRELG_18615 [Gemmataceae bacterium]
MLFLGRIEAVSESNPIDPGKWLALIDSHGSLGHVPSHMGINPFTRELWEFKAPYSTADIWIGSARAGSIWWALDGSPVLIVQAEEDSAEAVANIVKEVATRLGGRFVREAAEK